MRLKMNAVVGSFRMTEWKRAGLAAQRVSADRACLALDADFIDSDSRRTIFCESVSLNTSCSRSYHSFVSSPEEEEETVSLHAHPYIALPRLSTHLSCLVSGDARAESIVVRQGWQGASRTAKAAIIVGPPTCSPRVSSRSVPYPVSSSSFSSSGHPIPSSPHPHPHSHPHLSPSDPLQKVAYCRTSGRAGSFLTTRSERLTSSPTGRR